MKEQFNEMMDAIEKNLTNCPWAKNITTEEYYKEIIEEANEVKEAVEKKDYENLKEELGDLLWDVLMLTKLCEKEGYFKSKEIMEGIIKKMKNRKPFIFENRTVTLEEGRKIWNEAKAKEKRKR